ncbi:MAG TPA: OmpH family outer membrane protein [Trueperaceae bacterium]|jgi:outer membrane protein|nr:OmpH family outer membrane protein [Trueperaceae bacterium]
MRRVVPVLFVLFASLAASALAQPLAAVGYVDSQYLLSLHPSYQQLVDRREMANAEISQVAATVQELQAKQQAGQALTPEEEERLQASIATLQALQQRYDQELQDLAQPAIEAVNAAIAQVAADLGIGVVFDANAARESGLIVYAAPGNDITPMVEEVLRAGF